MYMYCILYCTVVYTNMFAVSIVRTYISDYHISWAGGPPRNPLKLHNL